ncbi:hypothetical protein [Curtobacterium sp. VKM Ac-1376]|uniref:hypothetical protein n=1 Tax=Curtobacterium sp. VKM Ac-1376 TaxID=123312 RepID=UPI00188D197E|nr:hypothetical protein [Curtobacterium sp. VKM Ac-1376]MBF4613762.1 hypothetical protein [Curtobacterium sp. VKM Ac-1376]
MYIYMMPSVPRVTEDWCDEHGCSKTAINVTAISDDGVNGDAGQLSFCLQCAESNGD